MPLAASTWQTLAPAARAATVAAPVYAKRFRTLTGLSEPRILRMMKSQFAACSGKMPVCLKFMGLTLKRSSP